ncbi:MAG: hypothetical protein KDB46_12190 [Solirubrobacterales bacterium]|nr:hypothetical protein [Solirubrobacterales bacterium]
MKNKVLALGAAAAIAVALAACGSDDGDDTSATDTTTAAISQDDWVAQANQICADGNKEIEQAAPDGNDIEAFVTDTFIPGIQSQIDAIRALGAPEGMEDQITEFLDGAEDDLDTLEQDPSSLSNNSFKETNQEAAALGLDECAG